MINSSLDAKKDSKKYYKYPRSEMIEFIPQDAKKIIDIGCGEAVFTEAIKNNLNAEVWGLEINEKAAEIARQKLDKVLIGDINALISDLPDGYFDCVIFNDVLEHLVDPYEVLLKIKPKLSSNGIVVSSIPNIRHYKVLKDLIFLKKFEYKESGILDKTHLRFFTKKSIIKMFDSLGFNIVKIKGVNGSKSIGFKLFSLLTLGFFSDTRYLQFACVVKVK